MTSLSGLAERIEEHEPFAVRRVRTLAVPRRAATAPLAGSLTVIVPVENLDALKKVLEEMEAEIRRTPRAMFGAISELHVARWVVLPRKVRRLGRDMPPSLVLWTVFDGDQYDHVRALVESARSVLDRVYEHCAGYPGRTGTAKDVRDYLLLHRASGRVAAYDGTPGRSTEIIRKQDELAIELATFVRQQKDTGLPNKYVFLEVQRFVDETLAERNPELAAFARRRFRLKRGSIVLDALAEAARTLLGAGTVFRLILVSGFLAAAYGAIVLGGELGERFGLTSPELVFATGALVVLMAGGLGALGFFAWVFLLRRVEAREALAWVPVPAPEFDAHDHDLATLDAEISSGMNRMTILTDVKPGLLRRVAIHVVLFAIALRARRNLDGVLDGVETIHFAQWRLVDGGKRLLFMSNYDGRPLDYFQDFSDNAAPGINAIWGNTQGFPPTQNFIGGGARNLEEFQNAARVHQIATDVWYVGYASRDFSTERINQNWRIHAWLNAAPTPSQVDEWIALLEQRTGRP